MCPLDFSTSDWEQLKHIEHGGNAWELLSHNHPNHADIDTIESNMLHNRWTQLIHSRWTQPVYYNHSTVGYGTSVYLVKKQAWA